MTDEQILAAVGPGGRIHHIAARLAHLPYMQRATLRSRLRKLEREGKLHRPGYQAVNSYYWERAPCDSGSRAKRQDAEERLGPKDGRAASGGGIAQ